MPDVSIIAQKVLAMKECGPGKLNKSFPKDSYCQWRALHLLPTLASILMFILGLFTEIV